MNVPEQQDSIIWAIKQLGGISPKRIERAGIMTEWKELPSYIRSQVFRHSSTQDDAEMAERLEVYGFQISDGKELLAYLQSPKINLDSSTANYASELEIENARLREQVSSLQSQIENLIFDMPANKPAEEIRREFAKSGAKARNQKLSPERRRQIARNAANARYAKRLECVA